MTMKIHFTSSNSKEALFLKSKYCELYNQANLKESDVIVAIGGDGEMLKALRLAIKNNSSVFGLNKGHIGFLMNKINKTNLIKRINKASQLTVHPLEMECFDHKGNKQTFLGINEISLFRNTNQSSIISISVDGVERLRDLYCDGILVSTPVGSTAYNYSAKGPIIPLKSDILALTPISPFRPRNWQGALLNNNSVVTFTIKNPEYRPVNASADSEEVKNIKKVIIKLRKDINIKLLHDPEDNMENRHLKEQFLID